MNQLQLPLFYHLVLAMNKASAQQLMDVNGDNAMEQLTIL